MRERMARDGCLFFRGLAPKDRILELRRAMLGICRDAGWLDPKADLMSTASTGTSLDSTSTEPTDTDSSGGSDTTPPLPTEGYVVSYQDQKHRWQ